MPIIGNLSRLFSHQRGAAVTELLVSLPALLLMGLGGLQTALLYDAKTTLNYATSSLQRLAEGMGISLKRHGADLIGLCPFQIPPTFAGY